MTSIRPVYTSLRGVIKEGLIGEMEKKTERGMRACLEEGGEMAPSLKEQHSAAFSNGGKVASAGRGLKAQWPVKAGKQRWNDHPTDAEHGEGKRI